MHWVWVCVVGRGGGALRPRATQIKKRPREWERGGHPGHADKASERGRQVGRERNEGGKERIEDTGLVSI